MNPKTEMLGLVEYLINQDSFEIQFVCTRHRDEAINALVAGELRRMAKFFAKKSMCSQTKGVVRPAGYKAAHE